MLNILLEKELRDILYSAKFSITYSAAAVLILVSVYVGIRGYQASMREYELSKTTNASKIASLTDWRQVRHRVFRKPELLQVFVNGVANDIGRTTDMRASGELNLIDSRFSADPIFGVFRFLDFNFVVIIVFSLFAILFGYDAINGEKEMGTLKLVFANKVSRGSFIVGKFLGAILAFGVSTLLPIAIGCIMLFALGISLDVGEWIRFALIIVAAFLCFSVFLTMSIAISATVTRSSVSFLLSLIVWIISVFIIPKGSVLVASSILPAPNADAIEIEMRKFTADQRGEWTHATEQWFNAHLSSDPSFIVANGAFQDSLSKLLEEKRVLFSGRLNEDWRNKKEAQEKWALGLARLSPTAVFQIAAMNLAGTDIAMKYRYVKDLYQYQLAFSEMMREKGGNAANFFQIVVSRYSDMGKQEEQRTEPLNASAIPEFTQTERALGVILASSALDLGLLVVLNAILFACAFVAFLRFDLR